MEDRYHYFQAAEGYFWQWEEEGDVLAISAGLTIAYREFVAEVLEHLAGQGLPPFGSLLLTIIATNPSAEISIDKVYGLLDQVLDDASSTREPLNSAIAFLKILAGLKPVYKQGLNRMLLFQTLFLGAHNSRSLANSKQLLQSFRDRNDAEAWLVPAAFQHSVFHNDFRVISLVARKFPDADTIIKKMAALPPLKEEIQVDEPEARKETGDFPEELMSRHHTFYIGALIRSLWGSLQIPHRHAMPSQQPTGGISDLTNKGSFDRLLLSEFAHDDLVFLSRLANQEALFVHREVPPQHDQRKRVILLDVSIRNWGTPRTLAYALLTAIAHHPKTDIPCVAFAVGDGFTQVAFDSVDAIIASLQVLEPCLDPAGGLEAFLKQEGAENRETIFIAADEVFVQPAMMKLLNDYRSFFHYLIHTDASGKIEVYRNQQRSTSKIQTIHLDLKALWEKEGKKAALGTAGKERRKIGYPILLPCLNPKKVLSATDGALYAITGAKVLLRQPHASGKRGYGWELVDENLPYAGAEAEIGINDKGDRLLLQFNASNKKLCILNFTQGMYGSIHFHEWESSVYKTFLFYENRFVYCRMGASTRCWTFELSKDEILTTSIEDVSPALINLRTSREKELMKLAKPTVVNWPDQILQGITEVYINEVDNLVFNKVELRLENDLYTKLEQSGFNKKTLQAKALGRGRFSFADGSTVTLHKAGLMILESSTPGAEKIYLPVMMNKALTIATPSMIAGEESFFPPNVNDMQVVRPSEFWHQHMTPFIHNIQSHGTED